MNWICRKCAENRGCFIPPKRPATWHEGKCDCCLRTVPVTQPQDFVPRADRRYD